MFSHYSSFIPLVLVLFVWGTFVTLCVTVTNIYWMRSIIPTAHNSDSPLLRQPITPTAHYSDGPFFRQCKIELNPQIHGLTRCIQQDVPPFMTDHGLDSMFWKGKGAFILGCTSPFKAIMIDRPGMGKVKN